MVPDWAVSPPPSRSREPATRSRFWSKPRPSARYESHNQQHSQRNLTSTQVGAGIQIPPNSARLLRRWGVFRYLEQSATRPDSIKFRRWENGDVIGLTALDSEFAENFGSPYHVVHRADFHKALHQRAIELGVQVRLNSRVVEYAGGSSAVLQDGSVVDGDLVVAADGENPPL